MGVSTWLNPLGQSVAVSLSDPSKVQMVRIDYTVTVDPPSAVNGLNATGTVTIYVKEDDSDGRDRSHCVDNHQVTSARSITE